MSSLGRRVRSQTSSGLSLHNPRSTELFFMKEDTNKSVSQFLMESRVGWILVGGKTADVAKAEV